MSNSILQWLLLSVLYIVELDCEIYQDRPKIRTSDGDLILEPAVDKNIYLRTNGPKSSIFVGNIDILKTNTPKSSMQYQPKTDFDEYLNGPNGILDRLTNLENKGNAVTDTGMLNITLLWRRVNNLRRMVLSLKNQINSRPKDECDSAPCQHGGTCLNLVDGYHCLCPSNWEGRDCDVDVNECRNFAGTELGCQNGATCINRPGTYECLCKSGWYGLHCTRKAKDCSGGDFEMCGYGTCLTVTSGEGIKCICHQGWTSNATSVTCLTDINECDSHQGPRCSINPRVECINLPGSFRCGQCPAGYEGDGYICNDIDECITIPNGGCSPLVKCHNTIGSRICGACPPGYQGDGVTCTFRGSCNINHGGCHPSAQCVESLSPTGQTSQCICPEGMDGDGIGAMGCYISLTNFTEAGCGGNPCGIHGRCHELRSGYTCICYKGYGGAHCDVPTHACATNPCQNGGICKQDDTAISGFRCECPAQYLGSLCQVRSKSCGAILNAEEGNIAYPLVNTTATYNNNAQCAWVIHTAPDKVINATFSKFNIELAPECSSDFLQIHDGRKSSSQLIGRFCGNTLPNGGIIVSSHNNLYLWFHSDGNVAKSGFALHWTSIIPVCGGEVDATTHGHISSPGSPGTYPPNRDCYWHLSTTPGKRISLHFFALDIEAHTNCSFDYLAIYDGEHSTDPLISRYCNSTQPAPIQSAGSDVLIHFHSDAYSTGKGFQITYAPIEGVPGCGGYFTTDKGEIVSPTFNGVYQPNLLCEYKIKTSVDTRIKIDFKLFKLERSFRCRYDYLKIYDGASSDSQLVGKFCGTTFPTTYTSSSNMLYITFKTDRSVGTDGFRILYEAVCEKTLVGDSGVIKSPSYPFNYPRDKSCVYIISTDPGKAIQLTFQDFDIEDSRYYNCRYDYVEIRDGSDVNSTLLGRYCGGAAHIPPVQTSTHNFMYIRFKSDLTLSGAGFYANYTTFETTCGGIYRDTTGLINYPSRDATSYENSQSCQWLLIAPEGMHIKLTWNRFDIEDMSNCEADYLQITEIDDNNENYDLNKYCGNRSPPALTTSSNRLKLNFVSDRSIRHSGFSVSYAFLDERTHCGGNYVRTHGYIYSPGWPHAYEPNRDCTWTITVPAGQQIALNISNFDLERPIRGKCNLGDYLEIRNGGSDAGSLIGQYCGRFQYKRIISLANALHLHFYSDFYLTGSGFQIEWDGTITGCGGTLTSSTGSISSPNYPNDYHENAECFYRIVTSAGSRIRITFRDLELERTPDCRDDYVEIYDGRDSAAPSLGKRCIMSPESSIIETSGHYSFIKFRSDLYLSAKGFMLNYNTICNNNITGRYGVIESPDYPNNYPLNSRCLWNIKVAKGNRINITFTHFDIYRNTRLHNWRRHRFDTTRRVDCTQDYLEVKDISEPNLANKFCGNTLPNTMTTKGNSLQIQFVSGFLIPRTGFRIEWVIYGCGGHIQKQYGNINLDNILSTQKEIECEWLIETIPGKSISITFSDIYMLTTNNCTTDYIEIYNGRNANDPLLSKICYQSKSSVDSDSNYMFIRSVKQSTLKDVHFSAQFHSQKLKCGGTINSISGYIYSKNYPKNYDNYLDCLWFIKVPANHRIELNFIDLDLYSDPNSDYSRNDICGDSILIYNNDHYSPSANYTYRICPSSNKTQIVTKYNNVAIQFKTDSYGTAKGFKANFSVTCGAIISATQDGVIESDNFINHMKSCVWTITAPSLDQKITLTLTHMSLPKDDTIVTNRNCPSTFLRVLDGNDKSSPLIGEYCGRKVPKMIVSQGNTITLELGSYTNKITGKFSAHYSPITNACGGKLIAEEGTIASPSYPSPYPDNIDCEWVLSTSPGNTAYLAFEQLDLEYSEACNEDYLEIRENDGAGHLLGVYCGTEIPMNNTKSSKIYIKFHSNSKNSGRGFLLHYSYLHENVIEGDYGEITSPLYPVLYEGAGEYHWRIFTHGAENVALTIDHLQTPSHGDISYNKLTIYDGYDETAPILQELHGVIDERKTIQASSGIVYIILTMDTDNTGSKFHLTWRKSLANEESSEDRINCGSNQTELILPGQNIFVESPNYPKEYSNDLNCVWVYRTPVGRHLSLDFVEMEIEEHNSCFADSISMYSADLPGDWKSVKENICTFTAVRNETEFSNYMKLKFVTDSTITKKGFRAQIKSKCGGFITDLSGDFGPIWADMGVAYNYHTLKCEWTVKVRPGRTIQLRFSHFNITNINDNCVTAVVLRNGDSAEAPLLESGRYCGYEHEKKSGIITSSNALFVSYTSNIRRLAIGFQSFKIYYEEINYECGSTSKLTADNKWEVINSPNYPYPPIPFSECVWIFSGPPGEIIRLDFIDRFDLDFTDNCATESIEIRDGSSNLAPLLKGPYCGERPATIKSTSNTIYIKYLTQLAEPRNGFKANVSIDVCGGTIISSSGEVTSPGYPHMQVFPYGTVCQWRVIGTPRMVFFIKPEDIDLPQSQSSCATKVEIEETIPVNNTIVILKTICNDDFENALSTVQTTSNNFTIKLTFGKPDAYEQISDKKGFRIGFNSSRPACGRKITASEGYLNTPNYPQETTIRYCQWLIETPNKSRRVRLELIDIDQEKHRVSIFNDFLFHSEIQTIPSDDYNPQINMYESTGNKLAIYVWLNRSSTSHRFKAKFSSDEQALCGGDLNDMNQELVSPDIQQAYTCDWHYKNTILTDYQRNVTYNSILVTVNVNSSVIRSRCRYFDSQVIIKSPINNKGLTLRRNLCGNTQSSYRIPSSIVDIQAIKTKTVSLYFHLNLKLQPCGGTIQVGEEPINIFDSIPSYYNDTLDCAWIILAPINTRIEFTMNGSFSLECQNEYITIMQGIGQNSPVIGEFCKEKLMGTPLTTRYSYMYIQYHSDIKNRTNINVIAKTLTNQCGGILTQYQRIFTSPNYPKTYPANQECVYEIQADKGFRVSLNFIDRFVVEDSSNCTKDVIIIYDWKDNAYEEMARVCGRQTPPPYNSTFNRLKVVFRSDAKTNLDGFKAKWSPICGGTFIATEKEQILYSPGYPLSYKPYMNCHYEISTTNQQKILLKFLDFELEGSAPECLSDNLTVIAQSDYNYMSKILCGNEIPADLKSYESVTLQFKSDFALQRKGFKISYSIFTCGGKVNDTTIITSVVDDNRYNENMNCTWIIEAPTTMIVVVKFLYIDIENHPECDYDYVSLYDGLSVNSDKRLALLCGFVNSSTVVRSTKNSMVLQFITDSSLNFGGFKAAIYFSYSQSAGCGGIISLKTGSSRVLKSPLMGKVVYENYLDCHWSITSPPNTVIQITFTNFHIAPCKNIQNQTAIGYSKCDCDLVEIKDGLNLNSLVIGTYCGHTLPPQLITSENVMGLRLSTDGELTSSGFEATLTVQQTLCGQSLISVTNTPYRFKSPGYDEGTIARGLHCIYRLDVSAQPYSQVRITVLNLQLRPATIEGADIRRCNKDKLIISSTPSRSNLTFGKDLILNSEASDFFSHLFFYESSIHFPSNFELCGRKEAVDFYLYGSTSINLITSADTDNSIYKGVEIEVGFVGFCGRNYTELQGRVISEYYHEGDIDCYTLITAPENYTISAYFLQVLPEYWDDSAYLEIFDGNKTSAKKLVKLHSDYEDNYPVFSTGRYMLLYNRQHNGNQLRFDINYVATDKGIGCGGKLHNIIGAVTSPYYPSTYRHKSVCEWELETPVGTKLLIRFTDFDLGITCDQNYLQLVDSKGVVVRSFCAERPADYESVDNYVKLVFYTTMNNSGKGWSATFIGTRI